MPVLGSKRSGVILMVSVSDVRNVDWELNIGDYHTTLSPISRPQSSCWLECRCLTHGEPDRNGSHSYPWLMAAHLAAGIAADSPEEFEKYLLQLQTHVRTCLSLSPSKTFSIDIETCYPVDTVHNSPIDEYKQGTKELATKFDAQTIRTVAKLHDHLDMRARRLWLMSCTRGSVRNLGWHVPRSTLVSGVPLSANQDSSVWPQSPVHSSSIM